MPAFMCFVQGRIEETGRRGRRRKQLLDDQKGCYKLKEGSNRSQSVENSLWKGLWSCLKIDCRMNERTALVFGFL